MPKMTSEHLKGVKNGRPLSVAMLGTRGVPARYGGFETCVEEVGRRLVGRGMSVTVYCRKSGADHELPRSQRPRCYLGMDLVYLPAPRVKGLETVAHTALSVAHARRRGFDAIVVFNVANSPALLLLGKDTRRIALNVDGLERRRSKWGRGAKAYLRYAERLAVRLNVRLIADAQGIADYYQETHHRHCTLILYGAPLLRPSDLDPKRVSSLGLAPQEYHLVVARLEPENNVHVIVDGYARSSAIYPLVVVGDAPYGADYIADLHITEDPRIRFLGSVWDQRLLNTLYAYSLTYLHGHSVGGTNPSLLRAAGAGAPVIAHDNAFNREVLRDNGEYFSSPVDVARLVEKAEKESDDAWARGVATQQNVTARYDWETVTDGYHDLCEELARA